jgi:excinuclease UvrABC nuclease subunit
MTDQEFSDFVISKTVNRIEFKASQLPLFGKPIVYMALSKNAVLYIGMSANGMGRVFTRDHHVLSKIQDEMVTLEVYETMTEQDANELENAMIQEFRPLYNGRKYIRSLRNAQQRSLVGKIIARAGY